MNLEAREGTGFERAFSAGRRVKRIRRSWPALAWIYAHRQRAFCLSLTRRIVVFNLGGLVALLIGFLYLNQFREGLIDARVQSLQAQGEIIAAAIAASATVDTDALTIDPEKLLQLAPGPKLRRRRRNRALARFFDQPRTRRTGPAPARLADAHPSAHLRSRRLSLDRFGLARRAIEHSALSISRRRRKRKGPPLCSSSSGMRSRANSDQSESPPLRRYRRRQRQALIRKSSMR